MKKNITKIMSIIITLVLLISPLGIGKPQNVEASEPTVLVDTDFSDWETISEKPLVAGNNASISYVWDDVLERKVISAKLPNGLNASNSIYVPATLTKGKEYKVFIAYRVTAWSCISYNGSSSFDGNKPLDSHGWNSVSYTFTPTVDNAYFRIGTNQNNYKVYIAELRLSETVSVSVGTAKNGSGSVSETSAAVGEKVVFSALPDSGYVFKNWQDEKGNIVSDKATYEHTVIGAVTLTPTFKVSNIISDYYEENFEDGELFEGGYTTSGSFSIASSPDGSSKYSFKHTYTSGNTYYYIKTPSLSKGYKYTVSFKGYGVGENKWFRFNVHDSAGEYISKTGCTAEGDCWTEFSFDITPENDGWYVGFLMSAEVYIDDFKIVNNDLYEDVLKYYFEDFEDGELCEGGYTTSSSFVISATPDNSSKYCLKHNTTSGSTYYYIKTPTLGAGYTYKVSFKGYGDGDFGWARFNVHDSTSAYISKHECYMPENKWTEFSFDITPENDGWYVGFLMNKEVYIDDFKIVNTAFEGEVLPDVPEEEEPEIIPEVGDANADGKINLKDIVRIKKNIAESKDYKFYADVNYDNAVNSLDLGLFSKYVLGKVSYFPVGGIMPYAVTLNMRGDDYGVTWNTNGLPSCPVVEICEGDTFDKTICREIKAEYTKETSYNKTDENQTYYHVIKAVLSGLEEGKTYTYRCLDKTFGAESKDFTFTVNNREKESFKFIHISDSQTNASKYLDPLGVGKGSGWALANTFKGIQKNGQNFDFILHTGDIVEWSRYESYWRNMLDFNSKYFAGMPVMPISGNHEATYRNGSHEIFKHFNLDLTEQDTSLGVYYSFDYGNAKFIMLDTNDLSGNKIKADQYNWLVNTLKNNTKKWTIVSIHNPMYSVGKWGADSSQNLIAISLREQLSDLFAEYGVDIVLQGHDHTYSKTYPIGKGGVSQKDLIYESDSDINYCTNVKGVIYVMNGAAGDQSRGVTAADSDLYELSGNSDKFSWAEIEVSSDKLSVKVYKYSLSTDEAVLWNSYGIKK